MCAPSAICWSARLQWYTQPQGVIPFRPRPVLPILPPILPIPALYYTPPIIHIPALYYTPPILPIPARPIPSLSFRPLCCRYVGLIKPNSAHCIIICVLPIYLREQASWPPWSHSISSYCQDLACIIPGVDSKITIQFCPILNAHSLHQGQGYVGNIQLG